MDFLAGEYDVICTETVNIDRGDNVEIHVRYMYSDNLFVKKQ
jgi:hypothetical protein